VHKKRLAAKKQAEANAKKVRRKARQKSSTELMAFARPFLSKSHDGSTDQADLQIIVNNFGEMCGKKSKP
jgi:hypothetical protein